MSSPQPDTDPFPVGPFGEAPIMDCEAFARLRQGLTGSIVATSGGFDPVHPGHVSCIMASKDHVEKETGERPDYLVVIVNGDGFLRRKKGAAFQDLATRSRIVASLRGVDAVVTYETDADMTVIGALKAIQPQFFTKGGDRTDASNIAEWDTAQALSCRIVTGCGLHKDWSSSDMLARWGQLVLGGKIK